MNVEIIEHGGYYCSECGCSTEELCTHEILIETNTRPVGICFCERHKDEFVQKMREAMVDHHTTMPELDFRIEKRNGRWARIRHKGNPGRSPLLKKHPLQLVEARLRQSRD